MKKDFQRRVEDIKIDKVEKIKKKLKTEENTFCLEEISKFDIEKIRLLIIDLFKAEKILSFTNNSLKNFIKDSNKEVKTVEHLNIVVVGPSGVGKSTLINAILKVNAKENFGRPETKDSCYYESEEIPFLRLADSRGIEKDTKLGVDQIFESIQRFIKSQIETNDPDKFI